MQKALWFFIGIFLFFSFFLASSWAQWQIPRRGERPAKPPHGEWQIPVFKGEKPAKPPHGEWLIPVFKEERAIKGEEGDTRILPGAATGAINPKTGEFYPAVGGGAVDRHENVDPRSGDVYINLKVRGIPQNVPTTSDDPSVTIRIQIPGNVPTTSDDSPIRIRIPTPEGAVEQTGKFYPQTRRAPSASPLRQPAVKSDPPVHIGPGYTGRIEIGADGIARPSEK